MTLSNMMEATVAYVEACEECLAHEGVGGGSTMKGLRTAWLKERDAIRQTLGVKLTVDTGWSVVDTDNFGGDYPNESFVAVGIEREETAEFLADAMNKKYSGDGASRYFKAVPAGYQLQPAFEP